MKKVFIFALMLLASSAFADKKADDDSDNATVEKPSMQISLRLNTTV